MSDKKRKANSQASEQPRKKPQNASTVKVKHLASSAIAKPTIASCPGSTLPSNLHFSTYATKQEPHLLLHSSDHDTIDFTAVETRTTSTTDAHMKHYVAVYDPSTSRLTVTEAKNVAARSQVRQFETEREDSDSDTQPTPRNSRAALTEAFGTKKSRKAAQSIAENRLLARGGDTNNDALSAAILSSQPLGDLTTTDTNNPNANKPLPTPNLDTSDIRSVYSISNLIHPLTQANLSNLPIAPWRTLRAQKQPIRIQSHYISNRLDPLLDNLTSLSSTETSTATHLTTLLHLCRHLESLLLIHQHLTTLKPRRPIPPPPTWPDHIVTALAAAGTPPPNTTRLIKHFFPTGNSLTAFGLTFLRTTILAITLHIPPAGSLPATNTLVAEPTDIARDLAMDPTEVGKLYRELGCKLAPLNETEVQSWGLKRRKSEGGGEDGKKMAAVKVKFAKLAFPLAFVKVSQGRRERR